MKSENPPGISHDFADPNLLRLALSHSSSSGESNNERLEFLGDSILGFLISEALHRLFPEAREGQLSRLRADLVQKPTLAQVARELDLGPFLHLGSGELQSGGADRDSILADALEALVAAIYLDGGLEACRRQVLLWFGARFKELDPSDAGKNAKTLLQELLQARKSPLPIYEAWQTGGQDHQPTFAAECKIEGLKKAAKGHGDSRREAEQMAAGMALRELQSAGD